LNLDHTQEENLPVAAVPTAATPSTAAAPATTAVASTSTAASTAMPTAPTAASATFPLRTRFVDDKRSAQEFFSVESRDDFFGFRVIPNLCKAKASRLARKTVPKQRERVWLHADFRKQRPYLFLRSLER